jgi:protein-S-isoprenylcysteine O-methyltransferase Ste14
MAEANSEEVRTGVSMGLLRLKPPRIALVLLLINVGLHFLLRDHIGWHFGCAGCGIVLIALGFLVMIWAWWLFRKRDTAICHTGVATVLVDRGPFRFSRNPMYLGMTSMLAGCAWILGTLPTLFAPAAFFLLMNVAFIPSEEQRMSAIFGQRYTDYCRRVRRWL